MRFKEGFIICNSSMKEKILRKISSIQNYMFLTPKELQQKMTFRLKNAAVFQLMQKFNLTYSLCLEYITALEKIEDKYYSNPKLDSIVSILHYAQEHDLIEKDDLFLYKLKQFPVTFIDPEHTKEYFILKEKVQHYTEVYEMYLSNTEYIPHSYEFESMETECLFVMNQIKQLLRNKISLNHIYVVHANEEYKFLFQRLSKSYAIPMQFSGYKNISSSAIVKQFLQLCEEKSTFQDVFQMLDIAHPLYSILMDTINDYNLIKENPHDCIAFFTSFFKQTKYPQKMYVDAVRFVQDDILFDETDYVFYVGFNLGESPKIVREDGFLNDTDLTLLQYSTSLEKNQLLHKRLKQWILHTPNLVLTYKTRAKTENYFPSLLIDEMNLDVIKNPSIDFGYSKLEDELRLVGLYDTSIKYNQEHPDLNLYGIGDAKYKTYNHAYKPISKDILETHFMKKTLRLAYSNVKLFFACPFSYYADRILGLNEFKPQMAARMGTFSHAVLEDSYKENFDFETSVFLRSNENVENEKDVFFFGQMKKVLRNLIDFNLKHEQQSQLKEIQQETHIEVQKEDYIFEGYIDKLMYTIEGQDVYVAIVDYKTGADIVSLDNIEDGFHLQLPSYMYLLSHYEKFSGLTLHIIGLYLQKINIVIFDNKSDIEVQMAKKFMLEGYSVANPTLLQKFDPSYEHSTYIKSLGLGKDGFLRYSKIFLEQQQDEIIQLVNHLLDESSKQIHQGAFSIIPKSINGKNVSCTFCKYKDICFYDYGDVVELPHKPFGKAGDTHGMD